jgi:hypothetical protein
LGFITVCKVSNPIKLGNPAPTFIAISDELLFPVLSVALIFKAKSPAVAKA